MEVMTVYSNYTDLMGCEVHIAVMTHAGNTQWVVLENRDMFSVMAQSQ